MAIRDIAETQKEAEKRVKQGSEKTAALSTTKTPSVETGLKYKGGILVWSTKRKVTSDIDWNTIIEQEREARSDAFDCLEDSTT